MTFDPTVHLSGGFKKQGLLIGLVGTIERVAQDMLHHAADATTNPPTKDMQHSLDETSQARALSAPTSSTALPVASAPVAAGGGSMLGAPFERSEKEVGTTEEHDEERTEKEGPKRKRRKRRNSNAKDKDPDSTEKGHKRSYVEHHYHDHSKDLAVDTDQAQQSSKSRGGITTPFPMQLHDMLQHAESRFLATDGRAFHVHDSGRFVAEVMPLFFRQTRMSSFQRQLSLYGFLRLTRKGTDHGAYYHELFLRGMPHLCHRMQRTRIKGYWVRQSSSPETEPDFSKMPVVGQPGEVASTTGEVLSGIAFSHLGSAQPVAQVAAGGLSSTAPSHGTEENVKVPPMPPLGLALPASTSDTTTTLGTGNLKQPGIPSYAAMQQPPSLPMAPLTPQRLQPTQALTVAHDAALQEASASLDAHFSELNPTDRDDLVAFLSDVDLTSGDENSVDESFEEEAKIGRVSSERKRRIADVYRSSKAAKGFGFLDGGTSGFQTVVAVAA
eukprot:CAMPEP_0168758160 /NCGR_PEP_ID=MMETSP0724-20121128/21556_1 /TAXON_ID=265536 /ORGANISM="Amphiprora sp., Strain CCMP467" /LENGTH=497 /DNA_ID=CAMNT_0008807027 /DNA_START=172 /DNA_END=1665 /DNA_ORIENTATION=+